MKRDFHEFRRVVTNLAVLDFGAAGHRMRLLTVHPGVTVEQVQGQTGFELALADDVAETREPTPEELGLLGEVLDPHNLRSGVFRG